MNEEKNHSDTIANIIQKFESFQQNTVTIEDMPPRPITAPPKLNGNDKSVVHRKDELITKLCEEVCYLNNQIVELNDTKETKFIEDMKNRDHDHVFEDNYFMISGAVSPMLEPEILANFSTSAEKHLQAKEIPLEDKTDFLERAILSGTPDQDDCSGYNKLNTSPKLSNLSEGHTSLNVKLSHGDVVSDDVISNSDDVTCADDDVITGPKLTRTHFTSSQSDIENCGANFEETDYYRTSSRDPTNGTMSSSDSLNDELFFGGSDGSTHQSTSRGLQRFGGFENLFEVNEDVSSEPVSPNVQECVAKCDWSVECAPGPQRVGHRMLHSYDEMTEWHLSNSDLANDNCSEASSDIPNNEVPHCDELKAGYTNGYHAPTLYQNGYIVDSGSGDRSLREHIEKTQDTCDRMFEEFQRMRKHLQTVSDRVYQAPLLSSSHLACSRELLDNDSEQSSHRHSVAESPWPSVNNLSVDENNNPEYRVTRLKKTKSSARLFAKRSQKIPVKTESVTLRQIVRDVCAEEAVSDLAVLRTQMLDKNEEIEQLQSENDDLVSSISGLDSKIDDLSEQLSRLQSLNRSLQAQNFNLSTSLSHKDVTFDKLKKYLHKGPPSRCQSASPLASISEASGNAAHKYGFLNRSSQSISRRKSIRPWKRRLAVLDNNNLSIYKVETVESLIPINSIIDIQMDSKKSYGKHVIVITTDDNREHYLQANSEKI
ncbi:uncharacterized protein LOC134818918 isoform X2 [Bolinopsis microptera]|uniref:uncharacterized protein LOC134818918 isoform X2 n=1 Tax=Bolinopsis microptera TaxID=2820187 RepID=UPI00307A2F00